MIHPEKSERKTLWNIGISVTTLSKQQQKMRVGEQPNFTPEKILKPMYRHISTDCKKLFVMHIRYNLFHFPWRIYCPFISSLAIFPYFKRIFEILNFYIQMKRKYVYITKGRNSRVRKQFKNDYIPLQKTNAVRVKRKCTLKK